MITRTTDIIRHNDKDYLNVDSKNRLIAKLVGSSAEQVYGFAVPFGKKVDEKTANEMQGTYWLRVTQSDNNKYNDDVTIAVL